MQHKAKEVQPMAPFHSLYSYLYCDIYPNKGYGVIVNNIVETSQAPAFGLGGAGEHWTALEHHHHYTKRVTFRLYALVDSTYEANLYSLFSLLQPHAGLSFLIVIQHLTCIFDFIKGTSRTPTTYFVRNTQPSCTHRYLCPRYSVLHLSQ